MRGGSFTPFLRYKQPIPLGAPSLWPETLRASTPSSFGVKGIFKKPWTASQWKKTSFLNALAALAHSATG